MAFRRATWALRTMLAFTVPLALVLTGCGTGSSPDDAGSISWTPQTPESTPGPPVTEPVDSRADGHQTATLTPEQRRTLQPNELASIPVLQYHVITTDESKEADPFVRTAEHMREDLQWLYDHGFYVITTRELLKNRISAPAGKRPVVLTFDDSPASQFRWDEGGDGERRIDPDTAMGVLESFFQDHPDFGRGGQFAVLPFNCFADGTPLNTIEDCPDKLRWLAGNGYEIVNHTAGHQDLRDVTDEVFAFQIADPVFWLEGIVQGEANLMDVLVMPYGNYPSRDLHPEQRDMMRTGFSHEGRRIQLKGAFMVGANPTESPSSSEYDPMFIARIQTYEESLDGWFGSIENGSHLVYVSDGNPGTVSIPDPLSGTLTDQLDAETVVAAGHQLVRYEPESGELVTTDLATGGEQSGWRDG